MGWEPYQTADPLEKEPQVCGFRLLILHFKIQFSKSIKPSTFHIFLDLTYPLRKKSRSQNVQKSSKNLHNRKTLVHVLSEGICRCLQRERDIGTKATLSDGKTTFRWNPALILYPVPTLSLGISEKLRQKLLLELSLLSNTPLFRAAHKRIQCRIDPFTLFHVTSLTTAIRAILVLFLHNLHNQFDFPT